MNTRLPSANDRDIPSWHARLARRMDDARVRDTLVALVLLNALVLGLETSASLMAAWGEALLALDRALLTIFVVEIALKLIASGRYYFRDSWNVFDFGVVVLALIPASGPLAVLRALRVLRVLRLIALVPSMRKVVNGLLAALPGLGAVSAIIALIFYVAAVMATQMFGADFPALFGSLPASAFTLFQVMTLEGWAMDIVRPVMAVHGHAWVFFLGFMLASTFTLLNLFIAVIVNAIQGESPRADAVNQPDLAALREELRALRQELAAQRG